MKKRYRTILDVKDDLFEELKNYKQIFSVSLYEYLEAVANLEISALRQENISAEQVKALAELRIYKELLYFNVCGRSLEYRESRNIKYYVEYEQDSFSINYGDFVNNVSLINVSRDDNYKVNIGLANYFEPTLTDITMAYSEKKEKLKETYDECRKSYSDYLYERIKDYNLEDLKRIWNREKEFVQKQNLFYKKFMEDTNLEYFSDFNILNNDSLMLDDDACKIYIKKKVKTPIFR